MVAKPLKIGNKTLKLRKTIINPDVKSKTVLTDNIFDYVELCIKRGKLKNKQTATVLAFWHQSKEFYNIFPKVSKPAKPLIAYYCFLNATKALLEYHNISYQEFHGVSGSSSGNASLTHEEIRFHTTGILPALSSYFKEEETTTDYKLKDILYNIPYIHRAYCLSYKGTTELFVPIKDSQYIYEDSVKKAYLQFELDFKKRNSRFIKTLPKEFEVNTNPSLSDKFFVRCKKRFKMSNQTDLTKFYNYNTTLRLNLFYIAGPQRLWYLKRNVTNSSSIINRFSPTLTFAVMHKLSELSRYNPDRLESIFNSQMGWVINEFIEMAPYQFIDEISSEITKQEIMPPLIRK